MKKFRLTSVFSVFLLLIFAFQISAVSDESRPDAETDVAQLRADADAEDAAALFELGRRLYEGDGVEKNVDDGLAAIRRAADAGNTDAQNRLGSLYCGELPTLAFALGTGADGKPTVGLETSTTSTRCFADEQIEPDPAKAVEFFRQAAARGNVKARLNLALCFLSGVGVEKDAAKAVEILQKLVDSKNFAAEEPEKAANALTLLAACRANGLGVEKDEAKAFEYLRRAAELSDEGRFILAQCYLNGFFVERDAAKGIEILRKLAEAGDAGAQSVLPVVYLTGFGVERDETKALEYLRKAVEAGNANAAYSFGLVYWNGLGVEQDAAKAVEYFLQAAEAGNADAQRVLNELAAAQGNADAFLSPLIRAGLAAAELAQERGPLSPPTTFGGSSFGSPLGASRVVVIENAPSSDGFSGGAFGSNAAAFGALRAQADDGVLGIESYYSPDLRFSPTDSPLRTTEGALNREMGKVRTNNLWRGVF